MARDGDASGASMSTPAGKLPAEHSDGSRTPTAETSGVPPPVLSESDAPSLSFNPFAPRSTVITVSPGIPIDLPSAELGPPEPTILPPHPDHAFPHPSLHLADYSGPGGAPGAHTAAPGSAVGDTDSTFSERSLSRPPSSWSHHNDPIEALMPNVHANWEEAIPDAGQGAWASRQVLSTAAQQTAQVAAHSLSLPASDQALAQMQATDAALEYLDNSRPVRIGTTYDPPPNEADARGLNLLGDFCLLMLDPIGEYILRHSCVNLLRLLVFNHRERGFIPIGDVRHIIRLLEVGRNSNPTTPTPSNEAGIAPRAPRPGGASPSRAGGPRTRSNRQPAVPPVPGPNQREAFNRIVGIAERNQLQRSNAEAGPSSGQRFRATSRGPRRAAPRAKRSVKGKGKGKGKMPEGKGKGRAVEGEGEEEEEGEISDGSGSDVLVSDGEGGLMKMRLRDAMRLMARTMPDSFHNDETDDQGLDAPWPEDFATTPAPMPTMADAIPTPPRPAAATNELSGFSALPEPSNLPSTGPPAAAAGLAEHRRPRQGGSGGSEQSRSGVSDVYDADDDDDVISVALSR